MRIVLSSSTQEAITAAADLVFDKISSHPLGVFGLATGKTMAPIYAELAQRLNQSKHSLNENFFFLLDEYLGLPDNHPSSFKHYIETHWLNPLKISSSQVCFPPAHAKDIVEASLKYEETLKQSGGIDLQLLGIGSNGHIGFNEPGSTKISRTRVVDLSDSTLSANRDQFLDIVPKQALTMGIGTILEAKELLLVATGKSKASVIKYLLNHHDDPSCPATYLKSHPHLTIILDPEAASKINLKI